MLLSADQLLVDVRADETPSEEVRRYIHQLDESFDPSTTSIAFSFLNLCLPRR